MFITDRGKPSHVLMTFETFCELTKGPETIVDQLAMEGLPDVEFNPVPLDLWGRGSTKRRSALLGLASLQDDRSGD